jgi:hypothetical protein
MSKFDIISKFCKKKTVYLEIGGFHDADSYSLVWRKGGHRRFEGTYVSISALCRWRQHVPVLVGTHQPQHKCCNSEDHNVTVLTLAKTQILCIWYLSVHNTYLSILVLSRLQEKSARRSAVRLESLNNSDTTGGTGDERGGVEVRSQKSTISGT